MKDIEKIKSEDLAAQVQDANPANFAIEQEVAQLVGATVPQPTEPSADDARELGAQLLVFLRRALTPIQTALRTAVAAIYAHLDSRCTAYTPSAYAPYQPLPPYDPMGTPPTPRTVANLLTALTAFSARKITNGSAPNDGIPDGMSLARLLCDTSATSSVTEIVDDNYGWTWNRSNPLTMFGSLARIITNCETATRCIAKNNSTLTSVLTPSLRVLDNDVQQDGFITNCPNVVDVDFSELETFYSKYDNAPLTGTALGPIKGPEVLEFPKLRSAYIAGNCQSVFVFTETRVLKFPELTTIPYIGNAVWIQGCPNLEELYMPKFGTMQSAAGWPTMITNLPKLKKLVLGVTSITTANSGTCINLSSSLELIELHLGEGQNYNTNLSTWSPTLDSSNLQQFLQNFREHIALRLTANGSGLTLTLSQAVRDAIHAAEATYGIEAIIVTQKGWRIQPDAS